MSDRKTATRGEAETDYRTPTDAAREPMKSIHARAGTILRAPWGVVGETVIADPTSGCEIVVDWQRRAAVLTHRDTDTGRVLDVWYTPFEALSLSCSAWPGSGPRP